MEAHHFWFNPDSQLAERRFTAGEFAGGGAENETPEFVNVIVITNKSKDLALNLPLCSLKALIRLP